MSEKPAIFKPIKIGPITVKNRIEVAPAAPFLAGHDASVSQELYEYTMSLARSGAGIVTIGVTSVEKPLGISSRILSLSSPLYVSGLSDLAEGIQAYGAKASIELVHSRYMLSPPQLVVNETTTEEVEDIIKAFAGGARVAQASGFDMVMIHGGHGNVPSMFFNKKHNQRSDRFGGSFENRCRFAIELVQAIRKATDGEIAIEYRISAEEILPGMTSFEETIEFAKAIEPYIDILHVSRGLLEENSLLPLINTPLYLPKAMNLPYAKRLKQELSIPVSVVGSFDLAIAEKAVADGDVDMVAMIRSILADTDCVEKLRLGKGENIRPCIRCNTCISRTHSHLSTVRCSVNPVIGRETRFKNDLSGGVKNVAVVGGGPAGMQAALTCAKRGHNVVLYEKETELGGNFKLASAAPFKSELKNYLSWLINSVSNEERIKLHLGQEATAEAVKVTSPDAVIIAVGAVPIVPKFAALGTDKICWVGDAEKGASVGENVIVCGGGFTGMEFALSAAQDGKKVKIVDLLSEDKLGKGGSAINLIALKQLLSNANVEFVCGTKIKDITEDGLIIDVNGVEKLLPCDTAVLSFGFRPNNELARGFDQTADKVFHIGDCSDRGGTIFAATTTAYEAAMQI